MAKRIYVPPHSRVIGGKVTTVDGHWRKVGGKKKSSLAKVAEALDSPVEESKSPPLDGGHVAPPTREALPERLLRKPSVSKADRVDFADQRKPGSAKVSLDKAGLEAALDAAGVEVNEDTVIKLRLRDVKKPGEQGFMRQIGPNAYRVVVKVKPKKELEDRHLYVLNNSLVHELRHVTQAQKVPNFQQAYAKANKKYGYHANPFEVEARFYGRLADHLGVKNTGPAGEAKGKAVWGFKKA